jgi:hypothetical protein
MSNTSASNKLEETVRRTEPEGWERLARETERELEAAMERVKKLKVALRIFTENAQRGEFYPDASTHN